MITVYTTEDCVACRYTKKFLASHSIAYTEIDVTDDEAKQDELRHKGFREMPVVITDHGKWSGYKREHLKGLVFNLR